MYCVCTEQNPTTVTVPGQGLQNKDVLLNADPTFVYKSTQDLPWESELHIHTVSE